MWQRADGGERYWRYWRHGCRWRRWPPSCSFKTCTGDLVGAWRFGPACSTGTLKGCPVTGEYPTLGYLMLGADGRAEGDFTFELDCDANCQCSVTSRSQQFLGEYVDNRDGTMTITAVNGSWVFDVCVQGARGTLGQHVTGATADLYSSFEVTLDPAPGGAGGAGGTGGVGGAAGASSLSSSR